MLQDLQKVESLKRYIATWLTSGTQNEHILFTINLGTMMKEKPAIITC